jgi:hypothetical protein
MVQDSDGELEPPTGYSSARAKDLIVNGSSVSTRWHSHGESRSLQTILPKVQEGGACRRVELSKSQDGSDLVRSGHVR